MFKMLKYPPCLFLALFFSFYALAQEFHEGSVYEHVVTEVPQSIHILKIDPEYFNIIPKRALDDGLGRESVSSLSSRWNAYAAINGGFFQIGGGYDGLPMGILKIQNNWFSFPYKPRGAIGWSQGGKKVLIDRISVACSARVGTFDINIDGLNRQRKAKEKIVYTPCFHRTTLTSPEGVEVLVKENAVKHVVRGQGSNGIPPDGWILSIDAASPVFHLFQGIEAAQAHVSIKCIPQSVPQYTSSENWQKMEHIVGGTPVLVRNGEELTDFSLEKTIATFLSDRHARTAVGVLKDGRWVFVVVDQHPPDSLGMTICELARYMKDLGCIEALNLDGGGSSTFVIGNKVVNTPRGDRDESDGINCERRVSDAILIIPR